MPRNAFPLILILLMLPLCVLPILSPDDGGTAGILRIGDICAELYTMDRPSCSCCAPLWDGGIAVTDADLSSVQEGDWATITLLDGKRLVMECAAILPCIRVGDWIVTQYGILRAEGDVIIINKCMAYVLARL